jgi:hypothetical protein
MYKGGLLCGFLNIFCFSKREKRYLVYLYRSMKGFRGPCCWKEGGPCGIRWIAVFTQVAVLCVKAPSVYEATTSSKLLVISQERRENCVMFRTPKRPKTIFKLLLQRREWKNNIYYVRTVGWGVLGGCLGAPITLRLSPVLWVRLDEMDLCFQKAAAPAKTQTWHKHAGPDVHGPNSSQSLFFRRVDCL